MNAYYHVKVQIAIELESGKIKKQSRSYLVNAVSPTDAEAKIYEELEGYPNDWVVDSIVKTKFVAVL